MVLRTPVRVLIVVFICFSLTIYQAIEDVHAQARATKAEEYVASLQSYNYDLLLQLQGTRDKMFAAQEQWGACEALKEQCCK
jgi:hypothetical protein